MGKRRFPPLTPREVVSILTALGFCLKHSRGSHHHWEREIGNPKTCHLVTVDIHIDTFDEYLIKSMIRQSGVSREEFYSATPRTAKKIC